MSPSVFLASCDPEDFDRTVASEVDLTEYPDRPGPLSAMDAVRFWGAPAGKQNETNFERLDSGDLVLFYGDGEYVATGSVGTTFADDAGWANDTVWEDGPSLLYTVEDFSPVSVPKVAVNHLFGYSEGYTPPGLIRVAESNVDRRPAVIESALERYTEKRV